MTKFAFKRSLEAKYVDARQIHTRAHDSRLLKSFFTRSAKVQKGVEYKCAELWNALETTERDTREIHVLRDRMRGKYKKVLGNITKI